MRQKEPNKPKKNIEEVKEPPISLELRLRKQASHLASEGYLEEASQTIQQIRAIVHLSEPV